MPKNSYFGLLFLLTYCSVSGQTFVSQTMEGRVYSQDGDVAATHVMNRTTNKATITDNNGFFSIQAKLNDTIVFSAIQYQRREIVVTAALLASKFFSVAMAESLTVLDEVIVMPYNLTGDMTRDADRLRIDPVMTASTLGLPNAYVKPPTQAQRKLFEATSGGGLIPLNPILNGISGRTKYLKKLVAIEQVYARTERVRAFYIDSLITADLKIPAPKIDDFMYFCEVDPNFQATVDTQDRLKIWEMMRQKSLVYRKNNDLD